MCIFYNIYMKFLFSDERDAVQKKTFTKWVNKHLKKVRWSLLLDHNSL